MSRAIELRCWNEHGKCFHGMSELGDKLHLFNNKNPSYVIEQFTGMLDCNGVKIFEGDILSVMVQELTNTPPKTGIISLDNYKPKKGERFHTGKKVPAIWTIELVDHLTYSGFKFYGLNRRFNKPATRSMVWNNEVKVIGNIHQNSELLK